MKKVSLLVTAIAVLLLCFACDNNEPVNKKNEQEERFKAIAASYLEHTVFPTYTELARQADQLVADLKTLRADKTQANLEKACTTFWLLVPHGKKVRRSSSVLPMTLALIRTLIHGRLMKMHSTLV